uniref:TYR_PHOSPHATASE_2 domain-containing protein n=1 Tax=Rhabditophanes sp. KR3021 TaxID=114890 RepID=A0AC35UH73_9BILA
MGSGSRSDCLVMRHNSKALSPATSTNLCQYIKPLSSFIQYGQMKFLITDQPNEQNMDTFIKELTDHGVKYLVRVCEPNYSTEPIVAQGIEVIDWVYNDGSPPPTEIINKWIELCKKTFVKNCDPRENPTIAIHCMYGLGRSPLIVAIALMESGLGFEEAVLTIRQKRRGACNERQLNFLKNYQAHGELKYLILQNKLKPEKFCGIM